MADAHRRMDKLRRPYVPSGVSELGPYGWIQDRAARQCDLLLLNVLRGGRKFQMLAGPKIGWRSERVGVFAKARAGVARIGEGKHEGVCIAVFPPSEGCLVAENRLALDVGGGFEIYPTARTRERAGVRGRASV